MPKGTRVSHCVEKVKKLKESLRSLQEKQAAERVNPGKGDKAGSSDSDEYVSGGRTGKTTIQGRLTRIHTKKASPSADVRVTNYTAGPKGKLPEQAEAYRDLAYRIDELLPALAAGVARVGAGALKAGARVVKGVGNVVKKVGSGVVKRKVAGEDEEVQEEGIGTKLGRTAVTANAPGTALLNKTKTGRKVLGGIKTGARAAGMVPGVGVVGDVVAGSIASGQRVLEKDPKRKKVLNKEIAGDALAAIPVVGQGTRGTQMGTKAVRRIAAGTEMNYKNAYVIKLMEAGKDPRKAGSEAAKREQERQEKEGTGVDNLKTFRKYKRARIKAGGKHRKAGGVPATETPQQKEALGAEDVEKRSGN